jgi:glycogen debranching enzyme
MTHASEAGTSLADSHSPWDTTAAVPSLGATEGTVTLVEGQTFCRSGRRGDIEPENPEGLFVLDTRVISRWQLQVDGHPVQTLAVSSDEPFSATFASHAHPPDGKADAEVVVFRHRHIGRGMRERIVVENYGTEPATIEISLTCDADFADLFAVKEGRVGAHAGRHRLEIHDQSMRFGHDGPNGSRAVTVSAAVPTGIDPSGVMRWTLVLDPREQWEACVEVAVSVEGREITPQFRCGVDDPFTAPSARMATWRATLPTITTDNANLATTFGRSGEDLGSLRIFDPDHPEAPVLAAGAPWFMTLFGRDSLLTAWMTLIADPSLALGVLSTLARLQGSDVDPDSEEEPGKILHEVRFAGAEGPAFAHGDRYYGSIDATPLFVMLVGELQRWGHDEAATRALIPHVDRAMEWIEQFGDRDGDGYVEYERANLRGLANQGWKDSWDGVRSADGTLGRAPIALCEVQGYVYAAYLARAHLADEDGDATTRDRFRAKARDLRRRFNDEFWSEEHGWYVLGLDADKRPIDALASNVGHCLWTGIVDQDRAPLVAARLLSPEMFSGWGVRTLASSMAAYNPISYHNGSVWPHDNAICASGLARYGFVEEAHRIIEAQLDVAAASDGRLPELFAGFDRAQLQAPASYPASCSPQAWAASAPLLWLRVLLRLDPWARRKEVFVHPELPRSIRRLDVNGISVGDHKLHVRVDGDDVDIAVSTGAPFAVRHEPRPPLSSMFTP